MYLDAAYAPHIEAALARMAPGEKVGWLLTAVPVVADGKKAAGLSLTMWTPSPLLGHMLHWTNTVLDPFRPLDNDAALLNETVARGLKALREYAAQALAGP